MQTVQLRTFLRFGATNLLSWMNKKKSFSLHRQKRIVYFTSVHFAVEIRQKEKCLEAQKQCHLSNQILAEEHILLPILTPQISEHGTKKFIFHYIK